MIDPDQNSPEDYVKAVVYGLTEAIKDAGASWRPTREELLDVLSPSDETNRLALAGYAYGVAKELCSKYPGPAILLYGAALDGIGEAPRTELARQVKLARKLLKEKSLAKVPEIESVLNAAQNYSKFDKVSAKLKKEFAEGMQKSGKYTNSEIDELVPEIVEVTHAVRHKGLIQRFYWIPESKASASTVYIFEPENQAQSSSDAGFIHDPGGVKFTRDRLRELVQPAGIGCAHAIASRLEERRKNLH